MKDDRGQRTEVGGQRSEDRGQRTEDTPVEHPGREPGSTGQGRRMTEGAPVKQKRQISRGKYITGRGKQRAKGGK